jgi:hypothetical protein
MGAASVDHGITWAVNFNDAHDPGLNEFLVNGWSLDHPFRPSPARMHYMVRCAWTKAFLVADGSIQPGGISLWGSENGVAYTKLQDLHTWPGINQIGGNGGASTWNVNPNCIPPIFIAGSGPNGEDAYWMVSSYSMEAGGAGNRTTLSAATLWRSLDGLAWDNVRDMSGVTGVGVYASFVQSTLGNRMFLVSGGAGSIFYTDTPDDLINASFATSLFNGVPGVRGSLVPMYGGTWLTFSQGTLTGPGGAWVSCDNGENFSGTGVSVVPQNQTGFMQKIGPSEALIVSPGFSDPTTETTSAYSDDGGETFLFSEPWITSTTGETPCMLELRTGARPIVMTRGGRIFVSSDFARGTFQTRTICPLANAGLAAARKLILCGAPIAINECSEE